MKIPETIPYFKILIGVFGLYAVVWMAFEGELWREILLSALALLLALFYLLMRTLGGRTLTAVQFVALTAGAGLAYGIALVLLTLFIMALKTGLHAHGPEYSAQEVAWLWNQLPVWGGVGLLAGVGLGFLVVAWQRD